MMTPYPMVKAAAASAPIIEFIATRIGDYFARDGTTATAIKDGPYD